MNIPTAARLRVYFNWLALDGLGPFPSDPLQAIRGAGYDGVQFIEPLDAGLVAKARRMGLGVCGSGRVNQPEDARRLAAEAREHGLECLTVHAGWGLEDDDEGGRLLGAVIDASAHEGVPMYVETHRATILQDMWRTLGFLRRFPDLKINADFSHWYTGLEMVYGGFDRKLDFIRPVFERVRFIHGRIGNPGCMQVDIGEGNPREHPYVEHFRELWTASFEGFLRSAPQGEAIRFAPELLAPGIYYARTFGRREESDRWQQAQVLTRIARECYDAAAKEC